MLREPTDVLGAVPYLLGFHPADCAVVVALRHVRLIFTICGDLPAPDSPEGEIHTIADELVERMRPHGVTAVLVVGYGVEEQVRPLLTAVRGACEKADIHVIEALRAYQGRYWSYLCEGCCPADGTPFDVSTSAAAAQAILAGRVALPSRAAYEQQVAPVVGHEREAMGIATQRASMRLARLLADAPDGQALLNVVRVGRAALDEAIRRHRQGGRLSDDEAAWLCTLLGNVLVRQLAWQRVSRAGARTLRLHRSLWMDLLRRTEPHLVAGPGSVFAFAAYRCGELALARLALRRVLAAHPDDAMAVLLGRALDDGLSPQAMHAWMRRITGPPHRRAPSPRRGGRPGARPAPRRAPHG